jgi:phenylalanyl-tRNA synthetase beta chain
MHVSLRWLNEYLDLRGISIELLGKSLTSIGLELEGIEEKRPLKGDVVVGKILKAEQHPNADKLRLCQVDVGDSEPLAIVCGAPNARAGIKVAVAKVGSELPGNFKIKESKIRGEKSLGMLCSGAELHLSNDHDGIIELPESVPLGSSVSEYFHMDDMVIEIGLTPNRSDCLGLIGLARDLAAKLDLDLKIPDEGSAKFDGGLKSEKHITVTIENPTDSCRFAALYVADVRPVASPQWLQRRLQYAGMRPINLLVDATNYVMLETGQPIHAYDERDISGKVLNVRRAKEGESIASLDEQVRKLLATDIVIADAKKAVGIAGVMGGANSEIKEDTSHIVIEVAHFNPSLVRKTSKRLALHTEASHRFERGTDVENIPWVARRVAALIQSCAAELKRDQGQEIPIPRIASSLVDRYPTKWEPKPIELRMRRLQAISGISSLDVDRAAAILGKLGCKIVSTTETLLKVTVPSWRHDLEREVDLIEEIVRIYGYDHIPLTLPQVQMGVLPEHPMIDFIDQSKIALAQIGLHETISFPFMGTEDLDRLGIKANHPLFAAVKLVNPLVEHHRLMRTTLIVGLIQAMQQNRRNGLKGSRLFELARTFHEPKTLPQDLSSVWTAVGQQGDHIPKKARKDDRPIERTKVAAIIDPSFQAKTWDRAEEFAGFFQMKDFVAQWLGSLNIHGLSFEAVKGSDFPWLHPGASATLKTSRGTLLGYIGELHPRTAKAFDLDGVPTVFEIDLEPVLDESRVTKSYISGNLRFPPSMRDIALLVPVSTSYDAFMKSFVNFSRRKYLKDQRLFDIYQGPNLPEGKKSMAFSLTFWDDKKTLTDQDVDKELTALISWLKEDLTAEQR